MEFIKVVDMSDAKKPIWLIDSVNMAIVGKGWRTPITGETVVSVDYTNRPLMAGRTKEETVMIAQAGPNPRHWVVEKTQKNEDAVFVFMAEVKETPSLKAGANIEARLTLSDGRVEKIGPYKVPHDTLIHGPVAEEMGADILFEIARQDPLPIVKIIIVNVAD